MAWTPRPSSYDVEPPQQRTLGSYPSERVTVVCRACPRRGVYRRDRLVAEHGATCGLVNLLTKHIAHDCIEARRDVSGLSSCRAHYAELDGGTFDKPLPTRHR